MDGVYYMHQGRNEECYRSEWVVCSSLSDRDIARRLNSSIPRDPWVKCLNCRVTARKTGRSLSERGIKGISEEKGKRSQTLRLSLPRRTHHVYTTLLLASYSLRRLVRKDRPQCVVSSSLTGLPKIIMSKSIY